MRPTPGLPLPTVSLLWALVAAALAPAQAPPPSPPGCLDRTPCLPEAISSFGACRSGGWLYVFGGHVGREHVHSRANVVGTFQRLNLADGVSWQRLADGPALQGTALVAAADGSIYRVGGMTALNAEGAAEDLHSTTSVARFDPARGAWHEVTPLPEPRSSHDAVVLDSRLYVVGGWNLHGNADGSWHQTAWVADLREQPLRWQRLPDLDGPRRAAALATFGGQIVVLGGMDDEGMLASVRVLDLPTQAWRAGPTLPGQAFGTAAVALGDRLLATLMDGRVMAWNGTDAAWTAIAQLQTPRIFHRLIDLDQHSLLVLGGGSRSGHLRGCERIQLAAPTTHRFHELMLPAPGRVTSRQAVVLRDETLWAFGGNRGKDGDRFAAEQFADDIWRIDLAAHTAVRTGSVPIAAQSMAPVSLAAAAGALVGGLGLPAGADRPTSLLTAWRFDARTGQVQPWATLPAGRTQGAAVQHGGSLFVFGGTDFTPTAEGGTTSGDCDAVLQCDPAAATPMFRDSGLRLPRPRRSFGTALLGDELLLLGGLGHDFAPVAKVDVLDFATRTWRELDLPRPWVSPQVAVLGDRIYVACGGTMAGQRFTEDRSLWCWSRAEGWQCVLPDLPFAVRHVQMLARRDHLLFYAANDARSGGIAIRTFTPPVRASAAPTPPRQS